MTGGSTRLVFARWGADRCVLLEAMQADASGSIRLWHPERPCHRLLDAPGRRPEHPETLKAEGVAFLYFDCEAKVCCMGRLRRAGASDPGLLRVWIALTQRFFGMCVESNYHVEKIAPGGWLESTHSPGCFKVLPRVRRAGASHARLA